MQDLRPLHRGTSNRADHPRTGLCFVCTRPWYTSGRFIEMRQSEFERLSKRDKELLKPSTITA